MQPRQLLRIIVLSSLVMLLLMGGVLGWVVTQSPASLLGMPPTRSVLWQLLPKETAAALVISTPLDQIKHFRQTAAAPGQRQQARHRWNQFFSPQGDSPISHWLKAAHVQFDREIAPWLGSESLWAIPTLDRDQNPQNGSQPGYLLALPTRDLTRSNLFLNLLWQRLDLNTDPLTVKTYKGVQVVSAILPGLGELASAAMGNRYVLLANDPHLIEAAIDSWQVPHLSLAQDLHFQATVSPLKKSRVGLFFAHDVSALKPLIGSAWLPPQEGIGSLAMGIGLNWKGVVLDVAFTGAGNPPESTQPSQVGRSHLIAHLPRSPLAVVSGWDLEHTWQQAQSLAPAPFNPLWASSTSGSILQLWSGIRGEFALALLPVSHSKHTDWILATDAPEAATLLSERLPGQGWEPQPLALDNREAWRWIPCKDQPSKDHPNKDHSKDKSSLQELFSYSDPRSGVFYLASSATSLDQALDRIPLAKSPAWKQSTAVLPSKNQGYIQVQLPQTLPSALQKSLAHLPGWNRLKTVTLTPVETHTIQLLPHEGETILQTVQGFIQFRS